MKKDKLKIAYRYGMRDALKFLVENDCIDNETLTWILEGWILKEHKQELENYKDFNK